MIIGLVLFPKHCDVMIRAIHRRTHEVHRAGIDAGIFLVNMLEVDDLRHERTVRCQHETAHLGGNAHITKPRRYEDLIERPVHALADRENIIRFLIRLVRNAYTT